MHRSHDARQCSKVELQTHAMPPNRCETDVIRLQGSLTTLNGRLAEIRKDMKAKKNRAKSQCASVKQPMWRAARVIMCLQRGGLELALSFLTQRAELGKRGRAEQKARLANWFLITDETEKQKWCTHPPSTMGKAALKEAERFLDEWTLHDWVRKQM